MKTRVGVFLWVILLSTLLWSHPGRAQQQIFVKEPESTRITGVREYSSDTIIVKFERGVSRSRADELHRRFGATRLYTSPHIGFERLTVPPSKTPDQLVQLYRQQRGVEYAERDPVVRTTMVPTDPFYGYQWHFDSVAQGGINMEDAWDVTTGAFYVVVAVVDTGVAYENYSIYSRAPDLAQTNFVPGYDFVNNDSHPNDDNGHGTHVTGTVAQSTNNGIGVAGIAFNGAVMPVKVLDANGSGYASTVADGIQYAADNGADVINLSLGGGASQTLRNACEYAHDRGVTLVCAAGNDGAAQIIYPAAYDSCCIAVGATRFDKRRSYYSNYGAGLDVVAPGGDVTVDQNNDGYGDGVLQQTFGNNPNDWRYWFWQGTSMATPHVSGVAALLLGSGVATTPADVRVALQSTATDLGASDYDEEHGWGLIDAAAALNYTSAPNTAPVADAGGQYSGTEDQPVTLNGSASSDNDGDTLTYAWDFGDGNTGSGVSVEHTYAAGGSYTVTLVVNDGTVDSAPDQATASITPVNDPPVADAGGPYAGAMGSEIEFDGSGSYDVDNDPLTYEWVFGDGGTGTGVAPKHSYAAPGLYIAELRVWDGSEWSPASGAEVQVTDGSEVELFYGGFENGEWGGRWIEDGQQDWFDSTQRSTQGSFSAEVDGAAADATLTSIAIDLQGRSSATATFSWYIESGLDTGEYLAFDVSPDNSNWEQKAILRGNQDAENTWHAVQVDLATAGWQQLYIRFRGRMSRSNEDANVDDVKVVAK